MHFIPEPIEDYCEQHTSPESTLLQAINRNTYAEVLNPRMISGHLQGRFLAMLSRLIKPQRILEIGAFTGYATLCLAEGISVNGIIDTIEKNPELEDRLTKSFQQSGKHKNIHLHIGNAMQIIPELKNMYQLIFIDADKVNYLNYYHLVIDKLESNGLLIADNVLWSGKVIEAIDKKDEDTKAIVAFNDFVMKDDRVVNTMLPLRDGLMLIMKK
jgi:predicted O-methyltransferase YrrM